MGGRTLWRKVGGVAVKRPAAGAPAKQLMHHLQCRWNEAAVSLLNLFTRSQSPPLLSLTSHRPTSTIHLPRCSPALLCFYCRTRRQSAQSHEMYSSVHIHRAAAWQENKMKLYLRCWAYQSAHRQLCRLVDKSPNASGRFQSTE